MREHFLYRVSCPTTGDLLYVGATRDVEERMAFHQRLTPWWDESLRVEAIPVGNAESARAAELLAIQTEAPRYNRAGITSPYTGYPTTPRVTVPPYWTVGTAPDMNKEPQLLRIKEAAEALGVSRSTLYAMFESGRLTRVYLKPGGPRVRLSEVRAMMDEGAQAS